MLTAVACMLRMIPSLATRRSSAPLTALSLSMAIMSDLASHRVCQTLVPQSLPHTQVMRSCLYCGQTIKVRCLPQPTCHGRPTTLETRCRGAAMIPALPPMAMNAALALPEQHLLSNRLTEPCGIECTARQSFGELCLHVGLHHSQLGSDHLHGSCSDTCRCSCCDGGNAVCSMHEGARGTRWEGQICI